MDASAIAAAERDVRYAEHVLAACDDGTEHSDAVYALIGAQNRLALIQGKPGARTFDEAAGLEPLPDTANPKDLIGAKKTNLHLVPSTSIIHQARAMECGAVKYGPYNWRDKEVRASIYVSACMRHLLSWLDGEEAAMDSGVHHLGHALACLGILLDAQCMNKLVDDRVAGRASVLLDYFDESKKS